jgi:hypothetical protein
MFKIIITTLTGLFIAGTAFSGFGDVVSSFPVPSNTGTKSVAWDGNYLWFCGGPYATFVKTSTTGSVVSSFKYGQTPTDYRGLTYDGQYLWFSDPQIGGGYEYHRRTTTGSYVSRFVAGFEPGVAWDPPS